MPTRKIPNPNTPRVFKEGYPSDYFFGYLLAGSIAAFGATLEYIPDSPPLLRVLGYAAIGGAGVIGYLSYQNNNAALKTAYREGLEEGRQAAKQEADKIIRQIADYNLELMSEKQALPTQLAEASPDDNPTEI